MTKGKMVLELLIYAKSAIKNFDQSEASFESHIVVLFLLCTERAATRTKPVLEADGIVNLNGERISQCRLKLSKEEHHPRSQGSGDYHGRLFVTKFIYLICKIIF